MRKTFARAALLAMTVGFFVPLGHAGQNVGEMGGVPTIQTAPSTGTVVGLAIASHTATSVVVSTGFASVLYRGVYVQNLSQAGMLVCGENINLSTITVNGVALSSAAAHLPPLPVYFPIPAGGNFFCMCNSVGATCRAITYRVR